MTTKRNSQKGNSSEDTFESKVRESYKDKCLSVDEKNVKYFFSYYSTWCWRAFFFQEAWFFYQKMYGVGMCLVCIGILLILSIEILCYP